MDRVNPQVTDVDMAWLAGIWDGEGTFSIIKQNKANGRVLLQAKATMENTSPDIISETCRILDGLGIKLFLWFREKKTDKHRDAYVVNIVRLESLARFCRDFIPYLRAKKAQASLVARYSESRLELLKKTGKDHTKAQITPEEVLLAEEVSALNQTGKSGTSTTLCERLDKQALEQKRWLNKS